MANGAYPMSWFGEGSVLPVAMVVWECAGTFCT